MDKNKKIRLECIKYEFIHEIMPNLLYSGTYEEDEMLLQGLHIYRGRQLCTLFQEICTMESVENPYQPQAFQVECYVSGPLHFIQMDFPYDDLKINNTIRAYIVYTSLGYAIDLKKYFIIRRFKDGLVHLLFIDEDGKQLLGAEVVPAEGVEKEHALLLQTYRRLNAGGK